MFVFVIIFAMSVGANPVLKGQCRLNPHPSVEYRCILFGTNEGSRVCAANEPVGSVVNPQCTPNYYSPGTLTFMRCLGGYWDYIAKCMPECGTVTPEGVGLVVGGKSVKRGELPWHAGIYRKTLTMHEQICGGSLISTNIVLSAAHCFWNDLEKQLPASQFAVAVGKLYRPWRNTVDQAQKSEVKVIHLPPRFQGTTTSFQDDLAVVIVTQEFQFKNYIRPVCLNFDYNFETQQLHSGNHGKVAGWGLTAANGKASPTLQVVDLPYVEVGICISNSPHNFRQYITSDKICAGSLEPTTALCRGDSGGGLVFADSNRGIVRYYLRGVVSTAPTSNDACNTATYTSFTLLSEHEQFIKQFWIESGEFHCQDGSSITATKHCDGTKDCADGSDETVDACSTKTCASYLFQCTYGACVDRGAACNWVRDCADGSDEAVILCGRILINETKAGSCILPPYQEHGTYESNIVGAEPGQGYEHVTLLNVTCEQGYAAAGSASEEFSCSNGVWTENIPKCISICGGSSNDSMPGYEFSNRTGHCYKPYVHEESWLVANRTCVAEGARLAVPNSEDEAEVLLELMRRKRGYWGWLTLGIYWESGEWKTVDGQTLKEAGYANWWTAKPSQMDKSPFVYIFTDSKLYNLGNSNKEPFICEMAPAPPSG